MREGTATVRLILNNYQGLYETYQAIVRTVRWDDVASVWLGVESAANELKEFTTRLNGHADGMSDLLSVNYASVDWRALIVEELQEINVSEDRAQNAGL